jgi:hypothetical protein
MWGNYLQNMGGDKIRREAKFVDPQAAAMLEHLMDREAK